MSAILGGTVSVGINGFAEFAPQLEAGTLRALAISSAERLPGVDIPTLREQGVNVEFENWRSLVAPPGITPADRARLEVGRAGDGPVADVARVAGALPLARSPSRWRRLRALRRCGRSPRALDPEEARDRRDRRRARSFRRARIHGWCSRGLVLFGLAALLRAVGDPSAHRARRRRPLALRRSRSWPPASCCICFWPSAPDSCIAATVLFWCTARAFDHRHPVRDGIAALAISLASYLLFARVLQLSLP